MRTDNTLAAPPETGAKSFLAQAEEFLAPHQARFDALISVVASEQGLAPIHITGPNKTRRAMAAKLQAVALAVEFLCPPLNVETVGVFLNLGRATVYRLASQAKKLAECDLEFAARLERLRPRIREALAEVRLPAKPNGDNHHG